jgi:DNA-binding IclR family transcriptional regulator
MTSEDSDLSEASLPLDDNGTRRGIGSATTAYRVLAALAAENSPASLGSIARSAELSPSQAHRYLASLVQSGLARQDTGTGLYDLGAQAIQIGLAALSRSDAFALTDSAIAAFTHATGRTTLIAVRGPTGPTVVRWHNSRVPVITSLAIGSVLPFLRSATGQAFLAFLGDDEVSELAARELAADAAAKPINLKKLRDRIRRNMFATVDDLLIPGLRAAAVPIFDIQSRPILVVTIIANCMFEKRNDREIINSLKSQCRQLTETIGATWPDAKSQKIKGR